MPHPIYGRPAHELEYISLTLWLPSSRNGHLTRLTAKGESTTARSPLWSFQETWTAEEQRGLMEPTDVVHWVTLAAAQDRPSSQEMFDRCTQPGGWEDVPLPF